MAMQPETPHSLSSNCAWLPQAQYEQHVTQLIALGFGRAQVVAALRSAGNQIETAADFLLTGIPLGAWDSFATPSDNERAPGQLQRRKSSEQDRWGPSPECAALAVDFRPSEASKSPNRRPSAPPGFRPPAPKPVVPSIKPTTTTTNTAECSSSSSSAKQCHSVTTTTLTRDLWCHVLHFVDARDMFTACFRVDKSWNSLVNDPASWRALSSLPLWHKCSPTKFRNLCKRCFTHLDSAEFLDSDRVDIDATADSLTTFCPKLRSLTLARCSQVTDNALKKVAIRMKDLVSLDLSWCDKISAKGLAFVATHCHQVECLKLRGCRMLNDNALQVIARLTELRDLDLSYCTISDTGLRYIAQGLGQSSRSLTGCQKIERLILSTCTRVTDAGIALMTKSSCDSLVEVDLLGCNISDQALVDLGTHCRRIRRLSLANTQVTDFGLSRIPPATARQLTHLVLASCQVSDRAVAALLHRCCALESINLSECANIGPLTLAALAKLPAMRKCFLVRCTQLSQEPMLTSLRQFLLDVESPVCARVDLTDCGVELDSDHHAVLQHKLRDSKPKMEVVWTESSFWDSL